ncbi:uncharacterized protein [Aegilops tauschii subsp. strangulata]|uniref:uncharacterized protein n=1 Tax=Aegilops tauschii subsp. strangulata TaxID=200361 RepID=UPI003CC844EC
MPGFIECVKKSWEAPVFSDLSASAVLTRKFKRLRYDLRVWSNNLSYLKKRCMIRYIKVGEENSKFFHAMASECMRKNSIASLKTTGMDDPVSDHDQMAGILWASFKNRMGQAQGISMGYDLDTLIQPVPGLEELSLPFSDAEIKKVLQEMPPRAPGPDGFNGLFGDIHQCKQSKRPIIILKLDFAKAFDTVEHEVILQMLKHKGFDDKWVGWVNEILSTGSSSVLLNGILGKQFKCKCGVRQGDPLSPLLFVIVADLLQSVVNQMLAHGTLSLLIPTHDQEFPIIQYADDTVIFLTAGDEELVALKNMLLTFQQSTGLKDVFSMFFLPLSHEAALELQVLEGWIMALNRDTNIPDVWMYHEDQSLWLVAFL